MPLDDFWAIVVTLVQAGLIIYAITYTPRVNCTLRRGWSWLVASLTFIFLNRTLFVFDCFSATDFWPLQHVLMALASMSLFLFIYSVRKNMKEGKERKEDLCLL